MSILSESSLKTIEFLVGSSLQEVLDDPCYPTEAREAWSDMKSLCQEVGLNIHKIAREQGSHFERKRLSEIVGEEVGTSTP